MCRRIDQTRGTRRTSSFTPWTNSHGSTKFGKVITADHKVLSEDNEPTLQHRCAMVMQDFSFYGIERNPKRNGSADDTKNMCATILAALETIRINLHRRFSKCWCLRRFTLEPRHIHSSPIWNERNGRRRRPKSQRKNSICSGAIQPLRRLVERSHGMFLPHEIFSKFYQQMDERRVRSDATHHSTVRTFLLEQKFSTSPISHKDSRRFHQFCKKMLTGILDWVCLAYGRWMDRRFAHPRLGKTWEKKTSHQKCT